MSTKKVWLLLVMILVGAVNVWAAEKEDAIQFKYHLETGMCFGYQLTVKTMTTQKVLGTAVHRYEEWQVRYGFTVLSGSNNRGGALLRAIYGPIAYRLDSPFQHYSYQLNPDDATLPDRLKPYAKLVGTEFQISLQKAPKLIVNAKKDSQISPEVFSLQQFFDSISSDNSAVQYLFPNLINNIFLTYPNAARKFKINDGWQGVSCVTNGQFEPNVKTEYRIRDVKDDRFLVALETPGGCKYQKEQSVMNETPLTKVVTTLAGSLAGQTEIAKESMLPVTGMSNLDLEGIVKRFGTDIPVTLKMVVQYQRL